MHIFLLTGAKFNRIKQYVCNCNVWSITNKNLFFDDNNKNEVKNRVVLE